MFKKVLIANRGEIAVRIIRTCREMGIESVALYDESDMDSLHVRLADYCVRLPSPETFLDEKTIVQIALAYEVDAVHPGYGFLAESAPIRAKEAKITGEMVASDPPEITTSASPRLIKWYASSKAWLPLAQAKAELLSGPIVPNSIDTIDETAFIIMLVIKNGEIERGPLLSNFSVASSITLNPPPPLLITIPTRFEFSSVISN